MVSVDGVLRSLPCTELGHLINKKVTFPLWMPLVYNDSNDDNNDIDNNLVIPAALLHGKGEGMHPSLALVPTPGGWRCCKEHIQSIRCQCSVETGFSQFWRLAMKVLE